MEKLAITVFSVSTSILPENTDIGGILSLILSIVVYGLGAAAVIGVIVAGIQYATARDNEAQVKAAKTRLFGVVTGLAAWAIMWTALNWLIPGGLTITNGNSNNSNNSSDHGTSQTGTDQNPSTPDQSANPSATNRADGSEVVTAKDVSTGSGNEGWLEI